MTATFRAANRPNPNRPVPCQPELKIGLTVDAETHTILRCAPSFRGGRPWRDYVIYQIRGRGRNARRGAWFLGHIYGIFKYNTPATANRAPEETMMLVVLRYHSVPEEDLPVPFAVLPWLTMTKGERETWDVIDRAWLVDTAYVLPVGRQPAASRDPEHIFYLSKEFCKNLHAYPANPYQQQN